MSYMNKYIKPLILVVAFLILSLVTVSSFAYFSASVQGNDNAYDTVITTGEMALMLNDGEQISLNNTIPGDSITKEFSVKNTGTVETTYDVYFSELLNEFEDKNDLVYKLESSNGCADSDEKVFPSRAGEESKFISACSINPNQIHNYILTITFKDDGTNQDDNKGKSVISKISVNEYNKAAYLKGGWNNNISSDISGMINPIKANNPDFRAKGFYRANQAPDSNVGAVNIATDSSDEEVLMWLDNDQIYLYSNAKVLYLNEDCSYAFYYLDFSELDLSLFNASLVTNMSYMFEGVKSENVILGDNFDTSNVTNMYGMFSWSQFNSYDFINNLDYSNVENLYDFFYCASAETDIELKNINFEKVSNMSYMFAESKFNNIKFTNVEAPNLSNVYMLFKRVNAETIVLENSFNQTSLRKIIDFVYYSDNLKTFDFGSFNTNGVTDITQFFMGCPNLTNVNLGTNFDTSDVEKIDHFISGSNKIEELDLGEKFDTTNIKRISNLVYNCSNLKTIHLGNKFHITSELDFSNIITYCPSLTTIYIGPDVEYYPNNRMGIIWWNGEIPPLVGGAGTRFDSEKNTAEYFRVDDPEHGKPGYLTLDPRYQ